MVALGATHWNVLGSVARRSNDVVRRYGGSWNTYYNHPKGYWLDDVSVDYWSARGRGSAIGRSRGDQVAHYHLAHQDHLEVAWLIWWGRWWRPGVGWAPYSGWSGLHYDHVHVTFNRYSRTCGCMPRV